jgi:hypothetical protein
MGFITTDSDGSKQESASEFVVRIRGENPIQANVEQARRVAEELSRLSNLETALWITAGIFVIGVWVIPDQPSVSSTILIGIIAAGIYYGLLDRQRKECTKEFESIQQLVPLDAYNTEFTSPLADRSTVRITVHFQVPRNLSSVAPSPYGPPSLPSHFVEQLNRVTEAKLITYTQSFTDPPSRLTIEDFLNRELVQFQNENNVLVLRVSVPIAIHIHPDKPKGVNV